VKTSAFFVSRPRLAAVIALVVLLVGALAAPLVPVALYPTLARPSISVTCSYPGANAVEVMNTVAGPLEEKVNGVEGMNRMTSACYDTGSYSLTVSFAVGYDRDLALMKVQSKVQQALSLLPQEVKNTGVTVESGTTEELGILTVRSPGGKLTHDQVADAVFGVINPAILRVAGVGKSTVQDDKLAVRVWMKPARLAALGLNTEDVVAAIKAQNVQASLGAVGSRPTEDETVRVVTLVSKGRLSSPKEFGEIIVSTDKNGGLVRLKDVATIGMGPQGYSYSSRYEETPSVYISIYLLPGANPLETMKAVKAELEKLKPFFPADLTCDMSYDTTAYMYRTLANVGAALFLAVLLAFVAVTFVVRSFTAGLVSTLAALLPMSLTLVVLLLTGRQVNLLSTYALLSSVPLVVGATGRTFALASKGRLPGFEQLAAGALVVGVALPLAFIDGVQGLLFRQFSVVFATMAMGGVLTSQFLVTPLAVRIFRGATPEPQATGRRGFRGGMFCAIVFAALAGVVSCVLYRNLPREFIPSEDTGAMYIDFKMAEGTPMAKSGEVMQRIYRQVRAIAGVDKCVTLLGESVTNGSGENQAKMLIVLKDWRQRGPEESAYAISRRIQKILDDIPDAECSVLRLPPVKGLGSQGGVCCLVQSIGDNDPVRFSREALRMRREFQKSPLVETVTGGFYADSPHLRVKVDRAKCELMKVPMSSLYTVMQHNLGSIYVNDVNFGTQVNRVTVMSDWMGRARAEDIRNLYVRSKTGAMVPVDTLVSCEEEIGPRACYRCNQYVYCTLQFIQKPGVSDSEAIEEVLRICREQLSPGFLNDWANFTYESLKSRGDEGLLVTLSLLIGYLILVGFRESCRGAFRTLLPSVAAVFGALATLGLTGVPLTLYSRYALVMLVALTTAMSLLSEGTARYRSWIGLPLLGALCALPLAISRGAGSAGSVSLGLTLFGGYLGYALLGYLVPDFNSKEKSP